MVQAQRTSSNLHQPHHHSVKVNTRRNREVQLTSKLPPLVTSTHERADVLVYNKEDTKVVLLVEVNSSPMLYTERKAVLGAADMLRLLRHTDKNFSVFTSFVFPKKECTVLRHYFGVVQAHRTYTNHTLPEITVCRVLLH